MTIRTVYNKQPNNVLTDGEINLEPSMTIADGYVGITTRIRELEVAGEQLLKARRERYHYDQDQPIDDTLTYLNMNADPTEVQEHGDNLRTALQAAQEEVQRLKALEAAPEPVSAPEGVSTPPTAPQDDGQ